MKIYRYEMPDGGGPWFNKDGKVRYKGTQPPIDDYLNGCDSLENLQTYFADCPSLIENCILRIYEVPDEEVVPLYRTHTVLFPKRFQSNS